MTEIQASSHTYLLWFCVWIMPNSQSCLTCRLHKQTCISTVWSSLVTAWWWNLHSPSSVSLKSQKWSVLWEKCTLWSLRSLMNITRFFKHDYTCISQTLDRLCHLYTAHTAVTPPQLVRIWHLLQHFFPSCRATLDRSGSSSADMINTYHTGGRFILHFLIMSLSQCHVIIIIIIMLCSSREKVIDGSAKLLSEEKAPSC